MGRVHKILFRAVTAFMVLVVARTGVAQTAPSSLYTGSFLYLARPEADVASAYSCPGGKALKNGCVVSTEKGKVAGDTCLKILLQAYEIIKADTAAARAARVTAANQSFACTEEAATDFARVAESQLLQKRYLEYITDPRTAAGTQPTTVSQPIVDSINAIVASSNLLMGLTSAEQQRLATNLKKILLNPVEYAAACQTPTQCGAPQQQNGGGTTTAPGSSGGSGVQGGSQGGVVSVTLPGASGTPGVPARAAVLHPQERVAKAKKFDLEAPILPEFAGAQGADATRDTDGDLIRDVKDLCPNDTSKPLNEFGTVVGAGMCGCDTPEWACNQSVNKGLPGPAGGASAIIPVGSYLVHSSERTGVGNLVAPIDAMNQDLKLDAAGVQFADNPTAYYASLSHTLYISGVQYFPNPHQNPYVWSQALAAYAVPNQRVTGVRAIWDVDGDGVSGTDLDKKAFAGCLSLPKPGIPVMTLSMRGKSLFTGPYCDLDGDGRFGPSDVKAWGTGVVPSDATLATVRVGITFATVADDLSREVLEFSGFKPALQSKVCTCEVSPICLNQCETAEGQGAYPQCGCKDNSCGTCLDGTAATKVEGNCVCNGGGKCKTDQLYATVSGKSEKECVPGQPGCSSQEWSSCTDVASPHTPFPLGLSFTASDRQGSTRNGRPIRLGVYVWNKVGNLSIVQEAQPHKVDALQVHRFLGVAFFAPNDVRMYVRKPGDPTPSRIVQRLSPKDTAVTTIQKMPKVITFLAQIGDTTVDVEKATSDEKGRVFKIAKDQTIAVSFGHNNGNQITTITDALGRKSTVEFDSSGRIKAVTSPDGSTTTSTWDSPGSSGIQGARSGEGSKTNQFGAVTTTYSNRGNPATKTVASTRGEKLGTSTVTELPDGRIWMTKGPQGTTWCKRWNSTNSNLCEVVTIPGGTTYTYTYSSDGSDRVTSIEESYLIRRQSWRLKYFAAIEFPELADFPMEVLYTSTTGKSATIFKVETQYDVSASPIAIDVGLPSQTAWSTSVKYFKVSDDKGNVQMLSKFNSLNLPQEIVTPLEIVKEIGYDKQIPFLPATTTSLGTTTEFKNYDPKTFIPGSVTQSSPGGLGTFSLNNTQLDPVYGVMRSETTASGIKTSFSKVVEPKTGAVTYSETSPLGSITETVSKTGATSGVNVSGVQLTQGLNETQYSAVTNLSCSAPPSMKSCYERGMVYDQQSCSCKTCKELDPLGAAKFVANPDEWRVATKLWVIDAVKNTFDYNSKELPPNCVRPSPSGTLFAYKGNTFGCGWCENSDSEGARKKECSDKSGHSCEMCSEKGTNLCKNGEVLNPYFVDEKDAAAQGLEKDDPRRKRCLAPKNKHSNLCEGTCGSFVEATWSEVTYAEVRSGKEDAAGKATPEKVLIGREKEKALPVCPAKLIDSETGREALGTLDKGSCSCMYDNARYATPYCAQGSYFDERGCVCLKKEKSPEEIGCGFQRSGNAVVSMNTLGSLRTMWVDEFGFYGGAPVSSSGCSCQCRDPYPLVDPTKPRYNDACFDKDGKPRYVLFDGSPLTDARSCRNDRAWCKALNSPFTGAQFEPVNPPMPTGLGAVTKALSANSCSCPCPAPPTGHAAYKASPWRWEANKCAYECSLDPGKAPPKKTLDSSTCRYVCSFNGNPTDDQSSSCSLGKGQEFNSDTCQCECRKCPDGTRPKMAADGSCPVCGSTGSGGGSTGGGGTSGGSTGGGTGEGADPQSVCGKLGLSETSPWEISISGVKNWTAAEPGNYWGAVDNLESLKCQAFNKLFSLVPGQRAKISESELGVVLSDKGEKLNGPGYVELRVNEINSDVTYCDVKVFLGLEPCTWTNERFLCRGSSYRWLIDKDGKVFSEPGRPAPSGFSLKGKVLKGDKAEGVDVYQSDGEWPCNSGSAPIVATSK